FYFIELIVLLRKNMSLSDHGDRRVRAARGHGPGGSGYARQGGRRCKGGPGRGAGDVHQGRGRVPGPRSLSILFQNRGRAKGLAGPKAVPAGTDVRTLKDANGNAYGQAIYAAAQKPEGLLLLVAGSLSSLLVNHEAEAVRLLEWEIGRACSS